VFKPKNVGLIMLSTNYTPFSKTTIHLHVHVHHVQDSTCNEAMEDFKVLVEKKVSRTFGGKNFVVVLVMIKTFLSYLLFNEDGNDPMELLKGE
jgi:hypothetical protein